MTETLIPATEERRPHTPSDRARPPAAVSERWVAEGPAPVVVVIGPDGVAREYAVTSISGATARVPRSEGTA